MTHYEARLGSFMKAYTLFVFVALAGIALFCFIRGEFTAAVSPESPDEFVTTLLNGQRVRTRELSQA